MPTRTELRIQATDTIIITTTIMTTSMTRDRGALSSAALYRLMAWLSPAFPTGGFSYSHGIEYAVEAGLVTDRDQTLEWIDGILRHGAGRSDAQLFALTWRAAEANDAKTLSTVAELAAALRGTAELALESRAQGAAFLTAVQRAWPSRRLGIWAEALASSSVAPSLPVSVALAAVAHGVPLVPALGAFTQTFAANLVSAAVRLVPLGQSDGLAVLAGLEPAVQAAVSSALSVELDDVGAAAPVVDWCSMNHETQYTRLFRS